MINKTKAEYERELFIKYPFLKWSDVVFLLLVILYSAYNLIMISGWLRWISGLIFVLALVSMQEAYTKAKSINIEDLIKEKIQ